MISVSFYLLTPSAKASTQVYVSISDKTNRMRFACGESFLTEYCNVRKKKGGKDLIKKNTPFYFEYSDTLKMVRDTILLIEIELKKDDNYSIERVKAAYLQRTGKGEEVSISDAIESFIQATGANWTPNTRKKTTATFNHVRTQFSRFLSKKPSKDFIYNAFWMDLRDTYFVKEKKFSNHSTNKYLTIFKQFLKYSVRKGLIKEKVDFEELTFLKTLPDVFNISLKEHEVETLISLDLSDNESLDRVRDLFILEILTGQRFSDIPKLLDVAHLEGTTIQIHQEKTKGIATIPIHPRLKKHLVHIFRKYPEGLPVLSNQKFNDNLKKLCKQAGFDKKHSWETLVGNEKIKHTDYRYNLITSHTGRRTFCTISLKRKIAAEEIMKVTGHKSYDQFKKYVKVDDEDLELAFNTDLLK